MNGLSLKTNTGNAMMAEGMLDVKVSSSHQCSYVHGMVRGSESEVIWESPWVGERDLWGVWSCLVCLASVRWPPSQPPFWQPPSDYLHNIYFKLKKDSIKSDFFPDPGWKIGKEPWGKFFRVSLHNFTTLQSAEVVVKVIPNLFKLCPTFPKFYTGD